MKNRRLFSVLAALLALLMLVSCGNANPETASDASAAGEGQTVEAVEEESTEITVDTPAPEPDATADAGAADADGVIRVSTVDEFLSAIAPNATIELAAGSFDLSTASNYITTSKRYYNWNRNPYDDEGGYELEIHDVSGLTIRGAGMEDTSIDAVPRFVNVLRFTNCRDLSIQGLTAGHTRGAGACAGGVLYFENCKGATVDGCGLYGCGTIGVYGFLSEDLHVINSHIYECSSSAVELSSCKRVTVDNCEIYRMGTVQSWPAYTLFAAHQSEDFVVCNCHIRDNNATMLLLSNQTRGCLFLSNTLENNSLNFALEVHRYCPVIGGCLFVDQDKIDSWYSGDSVLAKGIDGGNLDDAAFASMRYEKLDPARVELPPETIGTLVPTTVPENGVITVTTPDEFLQAIGPDRTIILDGSAFHLAEAAGYGGIGNQYFYWSEVYDGQELVIENVDGLTIQASSSSPKDTLLTAAPRYANVLRFEGCRDLRLEGFTAGHSKGEGQCSGGVLYFSNCDNVTVKSCRLYGCGILGIWSNGGTGLTVDSCEIYECSYGGVEVNYTRDVVFTNCDLHDVPSPALIFNNCGSVEWNDMFVYPGRYDPDDTGDLITSYEPGVYYGETTDSGAVPDSVSVFYQSRSVSELILRVNDSVILQAEGYFPDGSGSRVKYTWSCEDPSILSLTVSRDSHQCIVKVLSECPDGVLLTVNCNGVQQQVRIYCIGG